MLQKFVFSIPVDCDIMFSNHRNTYKKSIEKRQRKLITKVTFIKPFLESDENVLMLTKGYSSNSLVELILMGWLFNLFRRSIFVVTNKRMFHIPTTIDYSYRYSIAHIVYSRCRTIFLKFGTLNVGCASCNHMDSFTGISRKDRKKIKVVLQTLKFGDDKNRSPHREHLCPRCTTVLTPHEYTCKKCRLEFKSKGWASLLSLLLPGGGYFYIRKIFLGVINAILELAALSGIGIGIYCLIQGDKLGWVYISVSTVLFVIKKIVTIRASTKFISEFIPKLKIVKPFNNINP